MRQDGIKWLLCLLILAACDGITGPSAQFSEDPPPVPPWQCSTSEGAANPLPLELFVAGKAPADKAVITLNVSKLPFGEPVLVYGLVRHPGPDDAKGWTIEPLLVDAPAVCEAKAHFSGNYWFAMNFRILLSSPALAACPENSGAWAKDSELLFRISRLFDGPLHDTQLQFSLQASADWTTYSRNLTVKFVDVPSTVQYWPQGPLQLVPRADGPCADAFVHAVNLGTGHAPLAGLQVHHGRPSFAVRTTLGSSTLLQTNKAADTVIEGHADAVALPAGWLLDAHTEQVWHVEYCPTEGEPKLDTTVSPLDELGIGWSIDASPTTAHTGCLRIAQGDPLDLSAPPWIDLAGSGGLRLDVYNVCAQGVLVGGFASFGSPHIQFSARPFAPGLLAMNFNFNGALWIAAHHSAPLYVTYDFDGAGLPNEITAVLSIPHSPGKTGNFTFTAQKH